MLSPFSFIRKTLRHRKAVSIAVAMGVATATAVITGALLVGDSMRGSLRELTLERLGKIESILAPGQFFPVDSVVTGPNVSTEDFSAIALLPGGTAEAKSKAERINRIGGVQVVAADPDFWDLDISGIRPKEMPGDDSVVLNQAAAGELGVEIGDLITLRLPIESAVPADSPLGKRELRSEGLPRMRVADILPNRGLGRFSLSTNQQAPAIVFVSRELVNEILDREGQANALLFSKRLTEADISLQLDAFGLTLKRVRREDAIDYISITSENLLLSERANQAITEALGDREVTPVMTYLANAIVPNETSDEVLEVPYSTLAAMDSGSTLDLQFNTDSSNVPIILNSWTANRLGATVGSDLTVFYYEPEIEDGKEIEREFKATVTQIVPLTKPAKPYRRSREAVYDKPITPFNDPDLTPEVPGVTDQDSISDWDLPFPLTRTINREDDIYWNEHRLTPKAFIPIADGRRLFGSRFGDTTGLRISTQPNDEESLNSLRSEVLSAIAPIRNQLGWGIRDIRSQQLAASNGTTPFDGLFLALSFFVIFSAMMLIALLLRLGILQRIGEFGTLLAVGFSPRRVNRLALGETAIMAFLGASFGVVAGIGYAISVLWALRSWWVGAVTVPFLEFHASTRSLVIGGVGGWLVCMATAAWTLRFLLRLDPASLLGGRSQSILSKEDQDSPSQSGSRPIRKRIAGGLVLVAIGIGALCTNQVAQTAAAGFVGGGMLLLIAALLVVFDDLKTRQSSPDDSASGNTPNFRALNSLRTLAVANAKRSPLRSTLGMGLIATAAFLILAITAFRLSPTDSGTGGFDLIVTANQPISRDLRQTDVQKELFGRDVDQLEDALLVPFRIHSGDDASCNNLYQAARPTILGLPVTDELEDQMKLFDWAGTGADNAAETWQLLDGQHAGTEADPIPMILDQNTAMWSLQMTGGVGQIKAFDYGTSMDAEPNSLTHFRVAGLLAGSVLQGKLIIGESNFESLFPNQSGYGYYLVRSGNKTDSDELSSVFETRLVDAGVDVKSASRVLEGLLAVQNTYLRTFQSLGSIGLLLGTIGLAVSQLRSVLERRGELAVMRAIGFTRRRLALLVFGENFFLLVVGIGCGLLAAILAVTPYAIATGSSLPIAEPIWILLGILAFGMLAGLIAVWRVVTLPLVECLRADSATTEL